MSDRVRENQAPGCAFCNGADNISNNEDHAFQVALNDTLTPSQNWVIDTYGAYSRWYEGQTQVGYGTNSLSTPGPLSRLFSGEDPAAGLCRAVLAAGEQQFDLPAITFATPPPESSTSPDSCTRIRSRSGFNYDVGMINIRSDAPANFNFANDQTSCDPGPTLTSPWRGQYWHE